MHVMKTYLAAGWGPTRSVVGVTLTRNNPQSLTSRVPIELNSRSVFNFFEFLAGMILRMLEFDTARAGPLQVGGRVGDMIESSHMRAYANYA